MIAKLIPLDGSSPIHIHRDVTIVGRKKGLCDLVVDHTSVSKLHCAIAKTDGLLFIRDLGSTNGTKVNGQRVTRGALLPGDEISFASVRFRIHLGPGEVAAGHSDRTEAFSVPSSPLLPAAEHFISDADSESDVRLLPDDSQVDFACS